MIRSTLHGQRSHTAALAGCVGATMLLMSCGGGNSASQDNDRDAGVNKTYLAVEASDADGDELHYQWRVTGGKIDNVDSKQTVWTLPEGDGLHFAYVAVSDGRGGWVEQQYAVATDNLQTTAPKPAPIDRVAPAVVDTMGATSRLRFASSDPTLFKPGDGGAAKARTVFLPDVQVQLVETATGRVAFSGVTDLRGELDLPKLPAFTSYTVRCGVGDGAPLGICSTFISDDEAAVRPVTPLVGATQNLRLFGHVALADGAICGNENAFFNVRSAATVQLRAADGTALGSALHVNRYGDYQISAGVPVRAALKLEVACEGYSALLDVPAPTDPAGYVAEAPPVELSHPIANSKPRIVKMVANGPDGNVRGRMIRPGEGAGSGEIPGADHFLTFKGADTKLSACLYYRAIGAVGECDGQGNPSGAISFDDWKRKNEFGTPADVSADYINQRDLNLVRRMVATRSSSGGIAFYVCNSPGPDEQTQAQIDDTMNDALANQKRVACVAMEYTTVTGANGGQPFTKFLTFGPDGGLLLSINLDGRGEKYMPGSCVACHGGTTYNGRFPEQQTASPFLGARFLPFDTGNYLFSSKASLSEAAQSEAFFQLNQLVRATELSDTSATSELIKGWYASGHVLDKAYVAPAWQAEDATVPGAARFYKEVIGISCRTCHVALGPQFNWDAIILGRQKDASTHFCGGTADVSINASMPQALISSDRLLSAIRRDEALAELTTRFLGCSGPLPDPVYAKQ